MGKSTSKTVGAYRSAVTGQYVSKSYADKHPKTTVHEHRPKN